MFRWVPDVAPVVEVVVVVEGVEEGAVGIGAFEVCRKRSSGEAGALGINLCETIK